MTATLATVLLVSTVVGAAPNEINAPPLEKCEQIGLFIDFAWILNVRADGSGRIQYGSLITDGGKFPKGTIDFAKFYRSLVPTLMATKRGAGQDKRVVAGVIFKPWGGRTSAVYTSEAGVVERTFRKAVAALDPTLANRFEFLILTSNTFPGAKDDLPDVEKATPDAMLGEQLSKLIKQPAKDFEQIGVYTRAGWKLLINSDGGGELSIGRDASLTAKFPAKTFDFEEVYENRIRRPLLEAERIFQGEKAKPIDPQARQILMAVKPRGGARIKLAFRYARDVAGVKALFDRAWEKSAHPKPKAAEAKTRFGFGFSPRSLEAAWKVTPPIASQDAAK